MTKLAQISFTFALLAATAMAFICPPGKVGECCIAPSDTICTSATVVPGPGHLTYECKFIDQIAGNSLCCEVVDGEVVRGTCTFAVI
ncbi:hypothetical protein NA56DRAFT_698959 [Hyaloscypha hepaticicola]|uniref:Hydrophobin n=1 Tax=Hyaloscypha hepaticicola TaxID=2082293 RepID=A0A2J6QHZ7_9HELO|nr:hypothetical protein NA56DRAFT_698959 [Hyaloscypha hepaticicola]